jgi:DNA mismatch repair protein MSH4
VRRMSLLVNNSMAGKTTYLKMIGLLTIQGMLGCYVPAQYASIRLHDALLSKLGNGGERL